MRRLYLLACAALLVACSSDETKPGSTNIFGDAGTSGTGGSSGSGGSTTGGAAGSSGEGGTGGTSDAGSGGAAGEEDGGVEAGDAAPDVGLDVVVVVDTCPMAELAVSSKGLSAGGATPADFATAFNEEVAAMTNPGPMLMRFHGLDAESEAGWLLDIGPLQLVGAGPTVEFGATPATVPFRLGEMHAIFAEQVDASFVLRFAGGDIPVVQFGAGGQLDDPCETFMVEQLKMLVPATAADIPFHGSTVGTLMGVPDQDYGGEKANAWMLELSGMAAKAEM